MKTLWLVLIVNGSIEAYTPVGRISMKECEEYAAKQMMLSIDMIGRATFRCVSR
jgi:hypothetical protein